MSNLLLDAALAYAARGWAVLPLHTPNALGCSCKKGAQCTAVGKHPRTIHGLKEGTTNFDKITSWWTKWPDANVGVLTGRVSGLIVLDLDNHGISSGYASLADLTTSYGDISPTLTASTGSGRHLFFQQPAVDVRGSAGAIGPGIDIRAEAGYVVVAPSMHANGTQYAWENEGASLELLPDWLLHLATTNAPARENRGDPYAPSTAASTLEGARNNQLYRVACALRGQQAMELPQLRAVLKEHNLSHCSPPLSDAEVEAIASSACRHQPETGQSRSLKRKEQNPLYWWQFNTREWFANQNVHLMTDAQTGWYIRLLVFAWDQGGFLTADIDKLWRLAKASSKKAFERNCELVLAEFEVVGEGEERMLRHPKFAAEYTKNLDLWIKKKEAGEASRLQRQMAVNPPAMQQPDVTKVVQ